MNKLCTYANILMNKMHLVFRLVMCKPNIHFLKCVQNIPENMVKTHFKPHQNLSTTSKPNIVKHWPTIIIKQIECATQILQTLPYNHKPKQSYQFWFLPADSWVYQILYWLVQNQSHSQTSECSLACPQYQSVAAQSLVACWNHYQKFHPDLFHAASLHDSPNHHDLVSVAAVVKFAEEEDPINWIFNFRTCTGHYKL